MYRAAVLVLASCGRLDFGEITPNDADANNPGSDASALCVPAPEICNGIDDNCDGEIDEGCPCTPFGVTLMPTYNEDRPGLAWIGTGYLFVSSDVTGALLASIDSIGNLGATHSIGAGTTFYEPELAWNGNVAVVLWEDPVSFDIYVRTFDVTGAPISAVEMLDASGQIQSGVALGVAGDHFVGAWARGQQIVIAELGADGSILDTYALDSPLVGSVESIAATPTGYLLAAIDPGSNPEIVQVDRGGTTGTVHVLEMMAPSYCLALARGPGGYGVTWGYTSGQARFAIVDVSGTPITATTQIVYSPTLLNQGLAATPTSYTFEAGTLASTHDLVYATLDGTATITDGPTAFSTDPSNGYDVATVVVAAGREAGLFEFIPSKIRLIQTCR